MELRDAWCLYCEDKFSHLEALPDLEALNPRQTALILFENASIFTARLAEIKRAAYNTNFDDEADGALIWLARFDNFELWEKMSAGSWRVMYERFSYALIVAAANEIASTDVIAHLPVGLDQPSRARALLLQFLLGGAKTIDPRLIAKHQREGLPDLQSMKPIRKN